MMKYEIKEIEIKNKLK